MQQSCEQSVHPGWGTTLAVASHSPRSGDVIRAAQITVSEHWAASDGTCASVLGGFEHPLVYVEGWEWSLSAMEVNFASLSSSGECGSQRDSSSTFYSTEFAFKSSSS